MQCMISDIHENAQALQVIAVPCAKCQTYNSSICPRTYRRSGKPKVNLLVAAIIFYQRSSLVCREHSTPSLFGLAAYAAPLDC